MQLRLISSAACLFGLLAVASAGDVYKVDPVHSGTFFRVKHLDVGFAYGRFNDIGGTVTIDETDPTACAFNLEVKADSVDTANPKRDQHLKGPDFLNAKEFPTITFKSKQVKLAKEKTYEATGDLTLHGVTKTVTVELKCVGTGNPFGKGQVTGFEVNFTVKRSDYGMNFMPKAIGDDVWMLVSFEAAKQ